MRVLGCREAHQGGHILFCFLDGMHEQLRAMGAPRRASIGICSKEDELIVGSIASLTSLPPSLTSGLVNVRVGLNLHIMR